MSPHTGYPVNGKTCNVHQQLLMSIDAASERAAEAVTKAASTERQILGLQKDTMKVVIDLQGKTDQVLAVQKDHTDVLRQCNEALVVTRELLRDAIAALPKKRKR